MEDLILLKYGVSGVVLLLLAFAFKRVMERLADTAIDAMAVANWQRIALHLLPLGAIAIGIAGLVIFRSNDSATMADVGLAFILGTFFSSLMTLPAMLLIGRLVGVIERHNRHINHLMSPASTPHSEPR
jgi:hypothetical protein